MMKARRVLAIAKKETLHVMRDPLSLALAFLMPAILLLIFGYAITFDIRDVRTVVSDQDHTPTSRALVEKLRESGYFRIVAYVDGNERIDDYLDDGRARMALSIAPGFTEDLRHGRASGVSVILDGSDSNTTTIALGYVSAIAERFIRQETGSVSAAQAVDVRSRVWYNEELKSRNYIIPGLVAVIMSIIVAMLTSLTISREWDRGTMEQLISTPVMKSELLIGKMMPYFLIGALDTAVAVIVGIEVFGVPFRGSLPLLMALSAVFLFGGLSWGILVSIIGRTQMASSQMAMLSTYLPAILLSGFMFSIANMPKVLQMATYLFPARYFVSITKGIFLKGSPFDLLWSEALLLGVYGIIVFTIALRKFSKRVPL